VDLVVLSVVLVVVVMGMGAGGRDLPWVVVAAVYGCPYYRAGAVVGVVGV